MTYIKRKSAKQDLGEEVSFKYEILLSQGKYAEVSEEDFEELSKYKWYYNKGYACRTEIHAGKKSMIYMHRFIKSTSDCFIDHIDRNPLNNKRGNLRECTHSQNMRNSVRECNDKLTSKYKGVSWSKKRSKWECQIKVGNGVKKFLGYFTCEIECAKAYDRASYEYHGEFGVLNFDLHQKKIS